MKAKSIKGSSPQEIKIEFLKSMEDGFKPALAVVFLSIKQDREAICRILDKEGISIFGATSAGEFTDEGVESGSTVMLLLDMDPASFKIVIEDFGDQPVNEVTRKIGKTGLDAFSNPAFIISCSHVETSGEAVIEGLVDAVGNEATILGGRAGDDVLFKYKDFIFSNNRHSYKGIVALILDADKIAIQGRAVSGWKPAVTLKTITKSDRNWIHTIDDVPALDVLLKFTGLNIDMNEEDDVFRQIGTTFPLQVQQKTGNPIMVPPLFFNKETKAVMVGADVRQGTQIQFSLPPDFDVVDKVIESARNLKTKDFPVADALIIFSCISRLQNLGPLVNDEIIGIKDIWNVPMAGFFSYGEFGRVEGGLPSFHGSTCSWVALKEK
jgi:hypothetical protein